jgi:hypothetical protein
MKGKKKKETATKWHNKIGRIFDTKWQFSIMQKCVIVLKTTK